MEKSHLNLSKQVLLFLFVILIPLSGLFAKEKCYEDLFCVQTSQENGNISIDIKNQSFIPLSFLFEVTITDSEKTINKKFDVVSDHNSNSNVFKFPRSSLKGSWKWAYRFWYHYGSKDARHDDSIEYYLPYAAGEKYKVGQSFNGKFSHFDSNQYAIDWTMDQGTKIHAARSGRVIKTVAKFDKGGTTNYYLDKANYIRILHTDGTIGVYLHLKKDGVKVKRGQFVKAGDFIGLSGNTGFSSLPHLHFYVTQPVSGKYIKSIPIKYRSKKHRNLIPQQGEWYEAAAVDQKDLQNDVQNENTDDLEIKSDEDSDDISE